MLLISHGRSILLVGECICTRVNKDLSSATPGFVSIYLKTKQNVRKSF